MRKVYEVRGMMEWHPLFRVGRARVQVSFTGGHLGDGCVTPAVFETSDRVLQNVVEKSSYFRSGRIRLAASFGEKDDEKKGDELKSRQTATRPSAIHPEAQPEAPAMRDGNLFGEDTMEFDSYNEAAEYLHNNKGVSNSLLIDGEDIENEARKLGINIQIKSKK